MTKSAILFSKLNFVLKCVEKWLPLWKILKLVLEQNVTKQTYPKISCRSQKCLVQWLNQQFYLVNWILFSKLSRTVINARLPEGIIACDTFQFLVAVKDPDGHRKAPKNDDFSLLGLVNLDVESQIWVLTAQWTKINFFVQEYAISQWLEC